MKFFLVLIRVLILPIFIFLVPNVGDAKNNDNDLPAWAINPIQDNVEYIYGIGEGTSLAIAKEAALDSINGKLATVVTSSMSSLTTELNGNIASSASKEVYSKTFDTKLSSWEVIESSVNNRVFYVLIRMSRTAFVKDVVSHLETIDSKLKSKINAASHSSMLHLYLALNEIKPDLTEAIELVYVLQAVNPQFDSRRYLLDYQKYQNQTDEMLYQLRFKIIATPEMYSVRKVVIRLLNTEKLSVSMNNASNEDARILIDGQFINSFIFSEYTTQLRVSLQTQDSFGQITHSLEHVVSAASMINFDSAVLSATNMLEKKLKKEGILVLLGLKKSL